VFYVLWSFRWIKDDLFFVLKGNANLVINTTSMLLYLSKSHIYIFECKNMYTRFIFGWVILGHDFFGSRIRSWSFRFCVSIFLLAFLSVHCVSPHQRFHKTRRISTLKTKNIIFCVYILDHNLSLRMDHQFKEDHKMVPRLKISSISPKEIFPIPTLSLSPLCPRTSKRLSMGEEVGTMPF
jgi:hypothetical protein